jgi:hypothetical protein
MATTLAAIDPNLKWYLTLIVMTLALVIGTVWASRVWNDLKGEGEGPLTDPNELMSPLEQAFAAGHMTKEEYLRIKESARLAGSAENGRDVSRPPGKPRPEGPAPDPMD